MTRASEHSTIAPMRPLTKEQLADGMEKSLTNARELVDDAELLHRNGRWSRAVFLCQIAGEELGKYLMLASAFIDVVAGPNGFDWNKFWKRLTSHKEKLKLITFFEDTALAESNPPPTYLADLKQMVTELEEGKQKSLYSDVADGTFFCPSDLFGEQMASNALKWAQGRLGLMSALDGVVKRVAKHMTKEVIDDFRKQHGLIPLFERIRKKRGGSRAG